MGNSHFRSDVIAKNAGLSITGFDSITATSLEGNLTGNVTSTNVKSTNYVKVGTKYIFGGSVTENSASVVAAASALVSIGSLQGALYMNDDFLWQFTATNTAASLSNSA